MENAKVNKNIIYLFISKSPENHQTTKPLVGFASHQNLKKLKLIMVCNPQEQFAIIPLIPIHIGNLYLSFMCEARPHYLMVKTVRRGFR
jgi:hypothetical protein